MSPQRDVVILGGGPAGCASAFSLLAAGIGPERLLVVEASRFEKERIGESIPPDTRRLFDALGLLTAFNAEGHETCYGSASSWGDDQLGYNDFVFNPYGNGWHLDRRRFDAWLAGEVETRGVQLERGVRFLDVLAHGKDGASLALGQPGVVEERVDTRFVVDATGCRSRYARRMGAHRRELDRLVSAAAFFEIPAGTDGRAAFDFARLTLLEAVEYGWWYTARLPNRRVATAVATSHAIYKARQFHRPRSWLSALAQTRYVSKVLAECEPVANSMKVCTAPSYLLEPAYGTHWLAVGDAASAYDPISSRGIFKALADGISAGPAIAAQLEGDGGRALASHQRALATRFEEYAGQRAYFYDQERRWKSAPFWIERRDRSLQ